MEAPIAFDEQADYERAVVAALCDDAFNWAWNEGRSSPLEEAVK